MRFITAILAAGMMLVLGGTAQARDMALVIVNEVGDARMSDRARYEARLREAGFTVLTGRNQSTAELNDTAGEFANAVGKGADRVLILVIGRVVSDERSSWLLGEDTARPERLNLDRQGLPLDALADLLAGFQGRAVLMVGESRAAFDTGFGLRTDAETMEVPNGVTFLRGDAPAMEGALVEVLRPGRSLAAMSDALPGRVEASGFVPDHLGFDGGAVADPEQPGDGGENAYWNAVRDIGGDDALRAYLRRYPDGRYVAEARRILKGEADTRERDQDAREREKEERARATEARLGLSAQDRRQIQADLKLLGFDPRGVDGVFGPGSRAAIAAWQRANNAPETSYLTIDQVARIERQAAGRREDLRAEREREDRAYWRQTGADGSPQGLRAYLERYPEGIFASEARTQLEKVEREAREAAWRQAEQRGTAEAYRVFLDRFPEGPHSEEAQRRLERIQVEEQRGKDRREEEQVMSSPVLRALVETRLMSLGFNPGQIDGKFDEATRRAIAGFQRQRGIVPTGYLSRRTGELLLPQR
ncbi:Putative peptidoglycan binding domain-containing protein [Salinihabitans flavidus]|uniref:Putative peptidoglycan binding domain-containing protein n=1 Tax=Salinihabitans flavidus TaxID=569882 RepID=A0A1H8RXZ5_9RHOB|nr:peptidoglycan-binding domain-containing protein [Salinihabitans flavidus]SEO71321.1 Putative peptidoglycan binding domain-containing protein [Salinihabitans flavidus]